MASIKKIIKRVLPQKAINIYKIILERKNSIKTYRQVENTINKSYKKLFKSNINWENPKSFNEKIQVTKLYDVTEIKSILTDKYLVREWVKNIVNNNDLKLIPLLGIYNSIDEIDYSKLPNKYVIKMNNDSGSVIIVDNDHPLTKRKIQSYKQYFQKRNYAFYSYEMQYKSIKPKVLIEKYMGNSIRDYKFFCFNGRPEIMYISDGSHTKHQKLAFFDMNYKQLDIKRLDYEDYKTLPPKPKNFEKMKRLASVLSKDFSHVRVDLYEINGDVYFGEMTFTTGNGFIPFATKSTDEKLGSMWKLDMNSICIKRKELQEFNIKIRDKN